MPVLFLQRTGPAFAMRIPLAVIAGLRYLLSIRHGWGIEDLALMLRRWTSGRRIIQSE
jgi:hypothetical protein